MQEGGYQDVKGGMEPVPVQVTEVPMATGGGGVSADQEPLIGVILYWFLGFMCAGDRFWFKTHMWIAYVQIVLMVGMFIPGVNVVAMIVKFILMYLDFKYLMEDLEAANIRSSEQYGLIGLLFFFVTGMMFGGDRLYFQSKEWISTAQFLLFFGMFIPVVNIVAMVLKMILMIVALMELLKDIEKHPIKL